MATISTIPQQQKGSVSKIQVPWTDVMKMYKGMSGVDLIEQRASAYHFDQKSTIRLYLCGFFFDLMGLVCASMYIVYNMMHPNDLTLLDFKTIVSTCFIGRFTSQSRAPPDGKIG